jgi:hypothetical protein
VTATPKVVRDVLLFLASTVIPGFRSPRDLWWRFCSLLHVYVFRNGVSSSTRGVDLSQVKVKLWPTVGQPISLGNKPLLGPKIRFVLVSDCCGFVDVRRPLWLEDGSVIYIRHRQQYVLPTCTILLVGILHSDFEWPTISSSHFASWVLIQFCLLLTGPKWARHDLLKYRCTYFQHVCQRRTIYVRSLKWLTLHFMVEIIVCGVLPYFPVTSCYRSMFCASAVSGST